ncbi:MAG: C-type lectin domain-containing protein [Deltaproteobacteria bacterium]|nr:C-type lectin domain-containing protein [Deltaproteobacteria bacterium]
MKPLRYAAAALLAAVAGCSFDASGARPIGAPADAPVADARGDATVPDAATAIPDAGVATPDATAPPDADPCPTGYARSAATGSAYRYATTRRDWFEAEADCAADGFGTHLVVIADDTELDAIAAMVGTTQVWIGATDIVDEDQFVDVTGADLAFQPWKAGEPNDSGPGEDCVELADHAYNDDACHPTKQRYVCECDGIAPDPDAFTP